jgi:hypothetical protein
VDFCFGVFDAFVFVVLLIVFVAAIRGFEFGGFVEFVEFGGFVEFVEFGGLVELVGVIAAFGYWSLVTNVRLVTLYKCCGRPFG